MQVKGDIGLELIRSYTFQLSFNDPVLLLLSLSSSKHLGTDVSAMLLHITETAEYLCSSLCVFLSVSVYEGLINNVICLQF